MFSFVKNAIILGLNIHQLTVMSEINAEWTMGILWQKQRTLNWDMHETCTETWSSFVVSNFRSVESNFEILMLQYGKLRDGRVLHRSTSLLNLLVLLAYKLVYTCSKIGVNFIKYVKMPRFKNTMYFPILHSRFYNTC